MTPLGPIQVFFEQKSLGSDPKLHTWRRSECDGNLRYRDGLERYSGRCVFSADAFAISLQSGERFLDERSTLLPWIFGRASQFRLFDVEQHGLPPASQAGKILGKFGVRVGSRIKHVGPRPCVEAPGRRLAWWKRWFLAVSFPELPARHGITSRTALIVTHRGRRGRAGKSEELD